MSRQPEDESEQQMRQAIDLREERRQRWQREGERSLWQNLSMIGAFGWLIVTPVLLGIFLGRWLDKIFNSGITFTAALIFLGALFGSWLAWQRIEKQ